MVTIAGGILLAIAALVGLYILAQIVDRLLARVVEWSDARHTTKSVVK